MQDILYFCPKKTRKEGGELVKKLLEFVHLLPKHSISHFSQWLNKALGCISAFWAPKNTRETHHVIFSARQHPVAPEDLPQNGIVRLFSNRAFPSCMESWEVPFNHLNHPLLGILLVTDATEREKKGQAKWNISRDLGYRKVLWVLGCFRTRSFIDSTVFEVLNQNPSNILQNYQLLAAHKGHNQHENQWMLLCQSQIPDKQVRMCKEVSIHFQQRPPFQDKRWKNNLSGDKQLIQLKVFEHPVQKPTALTGNSKQSSHSIVCSKLIVSSSSPMSSDICRSVGIFYKPQGSTGTVSSCMDSSPTQSTSEAVLNDSWWFNFISVNTVNFQSQANTHLQSHPATCLYPDEGSAPPYCLPKVHSCGSAQWDPLSVTGADKVHAHGASWQPNLRPVIFSYSRIFSCSRSSQNRHSLDQFLFRTTTNLEQFACELLAVSPEKCYLFIIYCSFQARQFNSSTSGNLRIGLISPTLSQSGMTCFNLTKLPGKTNTFRMLLTQPSNKHQHQSRSCRTQPVPCQT